MIYLDHAATTPVHPEVLELLTYHLANTFGNPSSLHRLGVQAANVLRTAREQVADAVGASPDEIVFTSGGTEANNLAIQGLARERKEKGRHIVTSAVEHPSVLETCRALEAEGFELTVVPPDREGRVDADAVIAAVRPDTVLVTLQVVNSETGAIQPVGEVGRRLKERKGGPRFHVDAVQALGKIPLSLKEWGVDAASFSGHKIQGPKGVGSLFLRRGVRIVPVLHGGGQEAGLRSGTENLPAIAGYGLAAHLASRSLASNAAHLRRLREMFVQQLRERVPEAVVNGPTRQEDVAPHIVSVSVPGLRGEVLLHTLEEHGVYVSTGSACSSRKVAASHVLAAMGLSPSVREGTIRISLGPALSSADIIKAVDALAASVESLRAFMKTRD